MLAARFGIAENDALAAVRHKLENGISRVEAGTWRLNAGGPALDVLSSKIGLESLAREIQRSVHLIGHLVGYDYSDSAAVQPLQDNPRQLREQALRALATYFEKLAALTPIIVVLEDLHWADDSSLDALNQLAQALAGTPILVLAAARPRLYRRRPHWGEGWAFSSRLDLHPLSKRSSRKLVYEILQRADEIPENLETLVVSGAEGNPFYVEELIKMLIDDRVIATGAGRWQIDLDQLRHARVPVTLTGVLQARLDRLPPEERTVLQQASVVGSVFWDRAVLACRSEHDAGEKESLRALRATLSALRAREFVAQRESSTFENTTELTFKHAVLRDVTYESVLKRLRRLYHGLVADWLMDQAGERLSEYAGLISEHLALAGRCDEAACYLLETGDRARLRYAQREAVEHYEQALTIIEAQGDDDRTARILMRLGLAHHSASQFEAARQSFDRANQLWHETRRPPSVATAASAPHALRLPMMPPVSVDPGHLEASPGSSPCITDHLFSGLVGWDATGRIVPDLAERWQELDGGLVYLFQLRDDAIWSDGRPVTAEDFVHAFQRLLHPANSGRLGLLPLIKDAQAYHQRQITAFGEVGVSAPDPLTLRIELAQPAGHLLHLLAQVYPVPRHVVAEHGEAWTDLRHLVTNGPFRLEEWHEGRRLALQRNPSYHHRFPGNIDQVLLVLEEDPDAWLQAYEADELDAVRLLNLAPAALEQARQRHVAEYRLAPDLRTGYIGFALNRPPFDDLRVRLAFGLAADMETVAHVLFGGAFLPATGGFLPPGMPGHSPGIGLGYDPGRACQLLAEAGYPSARGFPRLTASVPHGALSVVEAIAAQWRDVLEVEVDCQAVDLGQGSDRVGRGQAQLWGGEMSATCPDPQEFSLAEGPSRWENERYLALLERAGRTADQAARQDLYRQADCLVIQEAPILPCYYGITHLLVKPWVRRFTSFWRSWHEVIIDQH